MRKSTGGASLRTSGTGSAQKGHEFRFPCHGCGQYGHYIADCKKANELKRALDLSRMETEGAEADRKGKQPAAFERGESSMQASRRTRRSRSDSEESD